MSRLIVKGLPRRYEEAHVRSLFGAAGDVTDAKVMRTADGRSRQFAFVGFRSPEDAARALQRVNRTYVDAAQVSVEVARPVGDAAIARPWSKYSAGSSAFAGAGKTEEKGAGAEGAGEGGRGGAVGKWAEGGGGDAAGKAASPAGARKKGEKDAAFEDFRDAVAKRTKAPLWTDASRASVRKSMVASRKAGGEGKMLERSHVVFGGGGESDDGEDDELYEELPAGDAEGGREEKEEEEEEKEEEEEDEGAGGGVADDGDVDDADYFKSKVKVGLEEEKEEEEEEESEAGRSSGGSGSDSSDSNSDESASGASDDDGADGDGGEQAGADAGRAPGDAPVVVRADDGRPAANKKYDLDGVDPSETGRLFVRNLAYSVTADDLETLFEPFGAIADVHLVQDPRTKKSRGTAFVLYVVPENAAKALAALDRTIVHGRLLHVLPGKPRPSVKPLGAAGGAAVGSNAFKEEREQARKESARTGADSNAFNAMFLSTDAVAGVMAERYGVGKADVYGTNHGESGNAAVRLAVGEARLQAETREYFSANGIDMDVAQAASGATRRKKLSRNAFLVKNLPARTAEEELEALFSKFGALNRMLIVPSGILAVVVFEGANDAKKAYASLAYSRLKDKPLYLEWLPAEAIVGEAQVSAVPRKGGSKAAAGAETGGKVGAEDDGEGGLAESLPQVSVFVKNLNFDTRDDVLRKHFLKVLRKNQRVAGSIRAVTVATRPNPKEPTGPRLSYGYGFVEFATERDAGEAVKLAQGSKLEGHTLELRMANRPVGAGRDAVKKRARPSVSKRKPSAKLMIRNIAFEATSRDVKSLFATFGQVKSIRVPRKQDGSHRGFGFVEFVSKNEATAALTALSAAHLFGRHLVIDYADETVDGFGSIEELQAKAAKQVSKRRRLDSYDGEDAPPVEQDDSDAQMMDEMYGH